MSQDLTAHLYNCLRSDAYAVFRIDGIEQSKIADLKELTRIEEQILRNEYNSKDYIIDKTSNSSVLFTLSKLKQCLNTTKMVKNNRIITQLLSRYFDNNSYSVQQEIFWRNPGGREIFPHQDRVYDCERHLSIIIPLSQVTLQSSPLVYCPISENIEVPHVFSFKNSRYCAKDRKYRYALPYTSDDIVVHTQSSLHKAKKPNTKGRRITYLRLIVKEMLS